MISRNKTTDRNSAFSLTACLAIHICFAILVVCADDSAPPAPPLDLGALANIASDLGKNPQIMNLVSTFLNQPAGSSAASSQPFSLNPSESDPANPKPSDEPLKRLTASQKSPDGSPTSTSPTVSASTPPSNPLDGLMTLLPQVMPGLNPGVLSSLLGNKAPTPGQNLNSAALPSKSSSPSAQTVPLTTQTGPNAAQSVINQVLAAYANGQIPSELIQLALSGRIPSSMVELALSGQVPPQILQMVITGQIPTAAVINFVDSVQGNPKSSVQSSGSNQSGGLFSTTRSIIELMISRLRNNNNGEKQSLVPSLLSHVPLLPSLPGFKKLGALVGGGTSNVLSA